MEGVDIGAHDFFVHHEGDTFRPPLVEGLGEIGDDCGVLGCDVRLLRVVGCEIKELPRGLGAAFFADERPSCVTDSRCLKFVKVGVGEFWPASDMGEEMAVRPVARGVFEQGGEASAFNLSFRFCGERGGADFGEGREKV